MPAAAHRRAATPWTVLVAVALALTGFGLLVAPSPSFAWSSGSFSSADESQLVALTNQARASAGLSALAVDSELKSIARWRSKDMSDRDYFAHDIPNPPGGKVFNEMDRRGYCYHVAGENIGWNNASDSTATPKIQAAFMASPGHKANILGKSWDHIGIGAYKDSSGKHFWTVLFSDKCGSSPKPTPKPTPRPTPRATPRPTPRATPRPTATPEPVVAPTEAPSLEPSPSALLTEPPLETLPPDDGGIDGTPAVESPDAGSPDASAAPGDGEPTDETSLRIVDPAEPQGLFETIVGGVAGFFFGG